MRLAVRNLALGLLVSMFFAGPASAQYMKITTDNPSDNTAMRATGTTILTITLDTDHDKNASLQTCNSHTAANACGSITTSAVLDLFSYTLALKASGGTVTWGTFTPSDAAYTDAAPLIFNDTEIEINKARPSGTVSPAGLNSIGTIPVTPVSGSPSVGLQIGAGALNPFGFGTGFGTDCSGFSFPNTYVVGDPADPCGNVNGVPGDWFDWDGARSASGEAPPSITAPATATGAENTAITPITATATDPDAGNTLTITQTGVPAFLTFSSSPAPSPNTATVSGTPGFSDSGPYSINWHVDDGAGGTANTSTQLTITNTDRPPTLAQPADMTVNEGSTAEQTITGSDPDADPLTFAVVDGPGYLSVQNSTATTGTIRLVPGFTSAGTAGATVSASDGTLFDNKSFSITVNNTNRAPLLAQPANMSVAQGATADQAIQATDPDGDPLTFSRVSGATFLTVTTTAPGTGTGTGNIHLAPGGADPVGTSSATVRASDATLTNDKNLTITVVAGANQPPVLTQPANVTVNEGATANNPLSATDADGQALTFAKVSGPTYATVTTTTPGTGTATGNVALAPGFSDSGTATVSVSASDGAASDTKSFTVTVNNTDRAPTLDAVANMTVAQGATADQVITASDPDGDALTFSQISGPTFMTVTTTNPTTGNIHLAAGASEPLGVTASSVRATDGSLNSNVQPFTVTVTAGANQPPVLAQPADMTVNENATADQVITATDGDGNPLTFTKVSGPTFLAVTTTSPGTGSAMGNIHLGPGFDDAGTYGATVRASDGSLNSDKSLNVTVNNVNRAPTLNPISNMTVTEGQTADQSISGSDPDGDALTFSKVTGPTFLTITTSTPTTGNVHVAPLTGDSGASPYTVQGRASDGTDQATRIFSVTVQPPNRAPVLAQPSDVTVNEGDTADQTLNATDPDGDAVTFSLVSGPTYASVTTTSPGNGTAAGNLHLAPGFSDAGTAGATVRASDGALSDDKSLTITVDNVNRPPTLNQPTNMSVARGTTADQVITGSDPDGDALTFSLVTGPTFASVTTTNATTGNIHLAAGTAEPLGTSSATVRASDGSLNSDKSLTITVTATNQAPVLAQPSDMTVNEGDTANQALDATDQDGDALTFSLVSGPTYAAVTTTSPGTGTAAGNIHLAPGFSDAGTAGATVRASDSALFDDKSLTITVNNTNRGPTLNAISDMTVIEGLIVDQVITGSDPDGDALTFTKVTGPSFVTVTTTNATSGNVHVAPSTGDAAGSPYSASASASDGTLSDTKGFTVTVNPVQQGNHAPVLAQPSDMTVNEGATADQTLTASDQDGDALTFSKVGGPTFLTVGTSTPTTGNAHLAPGFADAGTYGATVRASDGSLSDEKSFQITVNNVNRAPVADAGGPYSGIVGIPVAFDGSASSDPDGDALTYSWDFDATDGITSDATGPTPSHTYAAPGTFTVTLTVTDNDAVPLSNTDTATADISASNGFPANAFVDGGDRLIVLNSSRPFWCLQLAPANHSFRVTDILPSSILASFNGTSIHSIGKTHVDDGRLEVCFAKDQLRILFASLANGRRSVTVSITGELNGGGTFIASLNVLVVKSGGPSSLATDDADQGNGYHDAFAVASPNPLNPSTTISFELSQPGSVRLSVYDVSGRLVKTLANEFMGTGSHSVGWDGTSRQGARVASGVYFYVLQTPELTVKSHLVVAK